MVRVQDGGPQNPVDLAPSKVASAELESKGQDPQDREDGSALIQRLQQERDQLLTAGNLPPDSEVVQALDQRIREAESQHFGS